MTDLTLDTLIASVRYGPEADSRAAEGELRRRLAAPPPAGVLHPLALAYLEAEAAPRNAMEGGEHAIKSWKAWQAAGCPIYTAAPPTLSAEGPLSSLTDAELFDALDVTPPAARAPVTTTPEPATVEPCGARMFDDDPAELACKLAKGHGGRHASDERWTDTPASPPARPPAVTRTIRERVSERMKDWRGKNYEYLLSHKLESLIDVLDEDEARRDADRRETR